MRISDWSSDVCSSDLKRISINITRLQPDRETGPPSDERGGAIGTETVDGAFIPALPEEEPDRAGGLHEEDVVELVEIPFVEQELVKQLELRQDRKRVVEGKRVSVRVALGGRRISKKKKKKK